MPLLSGDIGGTNTRLALWERRGDSAAWSEVKKATFPSPAFHGLAPIVRAFLGAETARVTNAAFGVAGPVIDDVCRATNLPWTIDARNLERDLGIKRIRLINDFYAIALGIGSLGQDDLTVLQQGEVDPLGPIAIIGAGTGLGEAVALPEPQGFRVLPSEGGHTDFAPRDDLEIELLRFLLRRHRRVSYERVVSGPGLATIYEFLTTTAVEADSPSLRARMQEHDPAVVIGEAALAGGNGAASRAVEMLCSLFGAEAGNLALKVLPTGGLHVAGGMAPKLMPVIQRGAFMDSFLNKGRMSPLLEKVRVSIITNTGVGLLGARAVASAL